MTPNLSRPFEIRADAIDGQKRVITATIATEAPVEVYDWSSGRVVRETLLMSGVEIAANVPLLTDHAREIGVPWWGASRISAPNVTSLQPPCNSPKACLKLTRRGRCIRNGTAGKSPSATACWHLKRSQPARAALSVAGNLPPRPTSRYVS